MTNEKESIRGIQLMCDTNIEISVLGDDLAESNMLASELEKSLMDIEPEACISRNQVDCTAQDFGSVLMVLLSAPVTIRLADGLARWLLRRSKATIRLSRTDTRGRERRLTIEGDANLEAIESLVTDFFTDEVD